MYTITRQDAADILQISTRSVDRYIKAWKLRSKKEGKIIYIHSDDVEKISWKSSHSSQEVIMPREKNTSYTQSKTQAETIQRESSNEVINAQSRATLEKIYLDMKWDIKIKDQAIQDLSIKLGQAQEIAKNSVSLIEFKKSQFLLEESKGHLSGEVSELKAQKNELTKKLKYEKSTNILLIAFCFILICGVWLLWFIQI